MNSLITISIEQGLIFAVLAMGVFITYKILDFPDLSVILFAYKNENSSYTCWNFNNDNSVFNKFKDKWKSKYSFI